MKIQDLNHKLLHEVFELQIIVPSSIQPWYSFTITLCYKEEITDKMNVTVEMHSQVELMERIKDKHT